MKGKKKNWPVYYGDDSQTKAFKDDKKFWFNEIADDSTDFELASDDVINTLREEARRCLESEVANFNIKNAKSNSDYRWMKTATQKGTVSDKIAASTVLIQDNPITNLDILRNLVSMVKVGKKKECIVVIDTLTELFLTCLLKPNLKLKFFGQRPLTQLGQICSGNARTRQQYLSYWYFEDQLKEIYSNFITALNKAAHDTLDTNKEKAIAAMYKLLAGNPEQEKNLLINIINKLGDPSQKVASKAIYCLNQLLFKHINMQNVVLNEIEKLLFRPNVGQKAQYYGICFLTQFFLSHDSPSIARRLIEVYFSFFKACIKQGEVDSRMMSALLMGVNRAYPYAKLEQQKFEEHIDTMYRVVHLANFNVGLHALMLLYQVSNNANNMNNRFYSALYKKLNDPKLLTTTHQAIFLNLIYKSLMQDTEICRIKAFIKRLLQLASFMQPSFACGVLYLISQLLTKKSSLQAIKLDQVDNQSLAKFEDNEEEKYVDVVDSEVFVIEDDNETDNNSPKSQNVTINEKDEKEVKPDIEILNANMDTGPSWYHCSTTIKQENKNPTCYDPFNRNPLFAGAEHTAYIELLNLQHHYHPTVSLYADNLLHGKPINYSGDPLKDFSLIRFLDRFVFKNPKKINSNDGSHPTFGIRKKYIPSGLRSLALNSERYLQQKEANIPPDELYLYKYMQKKVGGNIKDSDDSDLESVGSEEFEEMLDKMNNFKDMEDDLDYMNEIESSLKNKSTKNKKLRKSTGDSDGSDDDNDGDSEEDDLENDELSEFDIDDDNQLDDEDEELIQDLDDDDLSDMEFESDDNDNLKIAKKMRHKGDINGIFASAEEFASILEDEGNNSKIGGKSNTLSNKENAAVKQIEWEQKRNHWIQGYNKAVGKASRNFAHNKAKYNKKRPMKSGSNSKNKKRKT